jgi:DNA polymerase-3 subunit epsilon
MDFNEFQEKLKKNEALVKINDDIRFLFFVWYGNEKDPTVLLNTFSSSKEGSIKKLEIIRKKVDLGCASGIGGLDIKDGKWKFISIDSLEEKQKGKTTEEQPIEVRIPINKKAERDVKQNLQNIAKQMGSTLDLDEFVVIDTETTGIGTTDEVVEIAAISVKHFEIIKTLHYYIIPTTRISPQAQAVHGLSKEFLEENGNEAKVVFELFKSFVGKRPVVGHNVKFDIGKIKYHSRKSGVRIDLEVGFDTLVLSRLIMNRSSHKLGNILDDYGLRKGLQSHNAMDDVLGTLRYASILTDVYRNTCSLEHK